MKQKHLQTNKNSNFKVPDAYFDQFEDSILANVNIKTLSKTSGFKVPDNYFETFLVTAIDYPKLKKQTKILPLFNKKSIVYLSSIAAATILILINLTVFNKTINMEAIDTATLDTYILEEAEINDLAFLFQESQLTDNQFIDYNFDDKLISSFLESADVNELITD